MMRNFFPMLIRACGLSLALPLFLTACGSSVEAPSSAGVPATSLPRDQQRPGEAPAAPDPEATLLTASELLNRALERRAIGDDEGAATDLQVLLEQHPGEPEARTAHYYLAESFARRGRWTSAVAAFEAFVDESTHDADEYTSRALFWLARSYEETGAWENAIEVYERYRALDTPIEPYAAARQAAQQQALGNLAEAAQLYEYVATSDIHPGEQAGSYEKAIALRRELGQDGEALRLYQALLELASLPGYRARILAEAAALADALGQTDKAHAWLHDIVASAPETPPAVNAVGQLRAANDPHLAAADAAVVMFIAERYTEALPLFDEALGALPADSNEALDLRRMRALALRGLGNFGEALDELAAVTHASPDSEAGRQAQLDWIQTLGQSGEAEQAAQKYREFSQTYSDDWRAPIALDRAAQLYDRLNRSEEATRVRLELGQRFPQSNLAAPALNAAAWYYYNGGRPIEAQEAWQMLIRSGKGYEQARGAFWAGRIAQRQQNHEQARTFFEAAYAAAPNSYYGTRAAEELALEFSGRVAPGAPFSTEDWQMLDAWAAGWSQQPPLGESYAEALNATANSSTVQRAIALQQVGLHTEAVAEWNSARDPWDKAPAYLLLLARLAHEQGIPYVALKTAEQIAALAPAEALPPPDPLERLIFPTPYAELVVQEARTNGVDPRLFYALLRQESLFNPAATSWVGARGLAQVMPTTGEGIARDLGFASFQLDDLYRPQISVRFGTYYIGQRIDDMEGSIHGGLAAYNGGLGNALRWANGSSVGDADLFTESIDFPETQGYVKHVYGYYGAYRRLYTLP